MQCCIVRWMVCLVVACVLAGCGGSSGTPAANGGGGGSGIKVVAADKLPPLGDYLPPLDVGRIEAAPPKDWKVPSRGSQCLARFVAGTSELPRVEITGEDSSYGEIQTLTKDDLQKFTDMIVKELADRQDVLEPALPMIIGDTPYVRHVRKSIINFKRTNVNDRVPVERQILQTIAGGRVYTVDLQIAEGTLGQNPQFRDAAYAVAAGIRFLKAGDSSVPAEPPPAAEPVNEEK
jgi:hypothetical protein